MIVEFVNMINDDVVFVMLLSVIIISDQRNNSMWSAIDRYTLSTCNLQSRSASIAESIINEQIAIEMPSTARKSQSSTTLPIIRYNRTKQMCSFTSISHTYQFDVDLIVVFVSVAIMIFDQLIDSPSVHYSSIALFESMLTGWEIVLMNMRIVALDCAGERRTAIVECKQCTSIGSRRRRWTDCEDDEKQLRFKCAALDDNRSQQRQSHSVSYSRENAINYPILIRMSWYTQL